MADPAEILSCSLPSFYSNYCNITPKTLFIPITPKALEYLKSDGIVLPTDLSQEECDDELKLWFSEVEKGLNELGGCAFPKLNWSSPKDASWIATCRTLKCTSVNDVCLLLKSSDFVSHDLHHPFDGSVGEFDFEYMLSLREWVEIDDSLEFRLFVKDRILIGICQRKQGVRFPEIEAVADDITEAISEFFSSEIANSFPLENYVVDVFLRKRTMWDVTLLDFAPWTSVTDSLLFTWDNLNSTASQSVMKSKFLTVKEDNVRPDEYLSYGLPADLRLLNHGNMEDLICTVQEHT